MAAHRRYKQLQPKYSPFSRCLFSLLTFENPFVLGCFAYQSWPSEDIFTQTEDHCRVIAASKTISTFDKLQVKKESTSDSTSIQAIYWNEEKATIITVSERKVIMWDALVGCIIKSFADMHHEITASCLDARRRKIFLGNTDGDIIGIAISLKIHCILDYIILT